MNKNKVAAATLAAAMLTAIPFITNHEGNRLTSYQDVVGVWTVCSGIAGVKANIHMTQAECDQLTDAKIREFMNEVASLISFPVSANTLAAHTSFAYNIGLEGYSRSKTLHLTNAGKIAQGCAAMMNWHIAGDKDCAVRQNGCYGLVQRRKDEIALCTKDLHE